MSSCRGLVIGREHFVERHFCQPLLRRVDWIRYKLHGVMFLATMFRIGFALPGSGLAALGYPLAAGWPARLGDPGDRGDDSCAGPGHGSAPNSAPRSPPNPAPITLL